MVDPRLYENHAFVFLESGKPEQLVSSSELKAILISLIEKYPDDIPNDVGRISGCDCQAEYLIENYCELTIQSTQLVQWFAVRLEKE